MEIGEYKIYPTATESHFLKLNTKDGRVWVEQVLPSGKKRPICQVLVNKEIITLESEKVVGRFELTPTSNPYIYVLLDAISGRTWFGQWSEKEEECGVIWIKDLDRWHNQ